MNLTIPLYVEEQAPQPVGVREARPLLVRPLFFEEPREQDENLQRATHRLARELRRKLTELARKGRHEEFAAYSFYPPMEEHILKLTLEVGNRRHTLRHLFITLPAFGRRIAWTPSVPEVWFEVGRGETVSLRAQEALAEHYRLLERQRGASVHPEAVALGGKAWLAFAEISIDVPSLYTPPRQAFFALLGGGEPPDGAAELERVGRSLNALYPDGLDHATNREEEIAEVTRLLRSSDKRPVLLVGKRLAGKTAIIHECVRRRMERRRASDVTLHVDVKGGITDLAGDVWLIAPQRLISGMSYVGQWEGRLIAILKEAMRRRHTLYFDDLTGLFYAGRSSDSSLSVAHVLKPYIERREVRVLAEITPEALRVLQELDRSFADLFQIVPIEEPNEIGTLRTLLGYCRALEQEHRCRFDADVLPTAIDLTRRYVADAAFPGKAAGALRMVATKRKDSAITRADLLTEFAARSGLSVGFLDDRTPLDYGEVVKALSREVTGQRAAIAACADTVIIAKARLNDRGKPLASFLFLGPTGVGKTQCAKSLAKYLFGDSERILRFDMNEFVTSYSVARLIGTVDAPEGLLTSAVRREPFAVLLFDEIEKAHPAVFDLLLGVMGDARLTDARGRTADFTNAIIILTSNLGVREAASELGFRQTNESDASQYRQAAERFFKPEFFNRLTRVVPFERLRREDVRSIARRLIEDLFSRDGLVRRGVKLVIEEDALNLLVDAGYHPQFGARALKRTLERQVIVPIAARLAATAPDTPFIIYLRAGREGLTADAQRLTLPDETAAPLMRIPLDNTSDLLDRAEDVLARIGGEAEEMRPPDEIIIGDTSDAATYLHYFLIREQARRITGMCRRADERLAHERHTQSTGGARSTRQIKRTKPRGAGRASSGRATSKRQLARLTAPISDTPHTIDYWANDRTLDRSDAPPVINAGVLAQNLYRFLQDCASHAVPFGEQSADYLQDILRETALLDALWATMTNDLMDASPKVQNQDAGMQRTAEIAVHVRNPAARILLTISALDEGGRAACMRLRDLYRALFEKEFNCRVTLPRATVNQGSFNSTPNTEALILEGTQGGVLAPLEAGMHLFVSANESYVPLIVRSRVLDGQDDCVIDFDNKDNLRLPPVLRIYAGEAGATLDLRSRLLATGKLGSRELRAFILSALPPPREFKI